MRNRFSFQFAIAVLIHSSSAWISNYQIRLTTTNVSPLFSAIGDNFLNKFCGDFDNYNQVVRDREEGLLPREGGGHEHIHCTLIPVNNSSRIAAFYFDGNPRKIFRFRYYKIFPENGTMTLYTLNPDLEAQLRKEDDPMKWNCIFSAYAGDDTDDKVHKLPNCDVKWGTESDAVRDAYAVEVFPDRPGYHGVMVNGEAVVESTIIPGTKILVRDQLSLWENEFWIHDRGFNPASMEFIYGNQRDIPYQLDRVAKIENGCRVISSDGDLEWTLGSEWRTDEIYASKLAAVSSK